MFRRLAQGDLPRIEAHLKALNLADRTSRFHSPVPDGIIAAYVGRIDLARMILIGAVTAETGALVGLAEAHLDSADGPETAEISVSVDARWRRRCLGHRLVVQAVWAAFARGAAEAKFCFIPENLALVRLATALGARLDLARGEAVLSRTEAARGLIRR